MSRTITIQADSRGARAATVAFAAFILIATAGAPVAAADPAWIDKLLGLDDDEEANSVESALAVGAGTVDRYTMGPTIGHPDPEQQLDTFARWFNNHSSTVAWYANQQVNATGDHNVIRIKYVAGGESETKFLIMPVEDGVYQPGTMQDSLTPPGAVGYVELEDGSYLVHYADGSTKPRDQVKYEVDETVTVSGDAVAAINGDLKTIFNDHISKGEDVPSPVVKKYGTKYGGSVNGTLVGGGA